MKKILFGLFGIIFTSAFLNCEKDDICEQGTPTTPRLIVEFYDNNSPTNKKNITDLKVIAEGQTNALNFTSTNKIELPLKVNDNLVNYTFTINSKSTTLNLEDKITMNYKRNDLFISRACGYISVFELNAVDGITLSSPKKWIQEIVILNHSITNEKETHVKIFF
ncbi:DUF6452 family protein [Flavobacterium sp.]|uniref:DUF6452 family protein n=1 Tax=Flavobacterium sp. TaxID=239 RepID=UPI003D11FA81